MASIIVKKVGENFEYGQEGRNWKEAKIVNQIWEKTLPIAQDLYPRDPIILLFHKAKYHLLFAKNILLVESSFLCYGWYKKISNAKYKNKMQRVCMLKLNNGNQTKNK